MILPLHWKYPTDITMPNAPGKWIKYSSKYQDVELKITKIRGMQISK